ncbi:MAG: sulfur carrier protein ThiS [Austwickia sp.]|nr:sulfur carrier protein ThiS [Austwickia sp.]
MIINGREEHGAAGRSLLSYVETEGYRFDRVAVEINGDIVPKQAYAERALADGDRVEIVHFMGGG